MTTKCFLKSSNLVDCCGASYPLKAWCRLRRLARKRHHAKAPPEEIVRGGASGMTGKNVIVAVIDTGIDFHHPDFITYDEQGKPTSRLLYFWDTTSETYGSGIGQKAPVSYPNGTPIGTVYTRDDMNAELRSNNRHIASWDTDGHGTACAGIAAGNGNGSDGKYKGVAPDADIIAVRVAYPGDSGLSNALSAQHHLRLD